MTAQNHEVQVVGESLPTESGFRVSQVNLNDGSVEGLRHATKPIETVQYHPEGAPGPLDALAVFDRFVAAARAPRVRQCAGSAGASGHGWRQGLAHIHAGAAVVQYRRPAGSRFAAE